MTNLDVSPAPSEAEATATIVEPEATLDDEEETSPERTGPPSETSSQDWDRLTDSGSQT